MSNLIQNVWKTSQIRRNFKIDTTDNIKCLNTVKPALSGNSKLDKTKILKTNSSLMKVESIAEYSLGAFCNTFDVH